ncbi:MAG: NUDIX domain-containing protein [Patescibacteria group bacterium]|jgi:putative (di)nucleoside polyphosphate hydrolase
MTDINSLPYRDNVAAIVFRQGKFLLLQRIDWLDTCWKFPQGGVDSGETDEDAVLRECAEELGTNNFVIRAKSQYMNQYDWSNDSVEKAGYRWRGQTQKFFLVEFLGKDEDFKLADEIKKYQWVSHNQLKNYIDHETKDFTNYFDTVEKVLTELSGYLNPNI